MANTSILLCFKPFFLIGNILLTNPYKVNGESVRIIKWLSYATFLTSLLCTINFNKEMYQKRGLVFYFDDPFWTISLFRFFYVNLHSLVYIFKTHMNHKKIVAVLKRFQNLENKLQLSEKDYQNIRLNLFSATGFFLIMSTWSTTFLLLTKNYSSKAFFHGVSYSQWNYFTMFSEFFFVNGMLILDKFLSALHKNIKDMKDDEANINLIKVLLVTEKQDL